MNGKVKGFIEYVSADEAIRRELNSSPEVVEQKERVSTVIRFAKKHGYDLAEEDLVTYIERLGEEDTEAFPG